MGKRSETTTANEKPASGKILSALTKLVQDKLPPGFPEVRSHEDSSNQDNNDVRLPLVKAGKKPSTVAANRKPASGRLSSALTKLALGIGQNVRAKKVLTLKTG